MARPREFDQQVVLDKAMNVFWSQGYSGTSMSDLTGAMGLSKSSLYDSFGSKHELFLQAMDHYRNNVTARIKSIVDLKAPPKQVIASVVGRAVDRILAPSGKRGCFMNNCAGEVAPTDDEVARRSAAGFSVMEDTFFHLIERGQKQGSIPANKNSRALARFLTATINGIMVIGKANPDRQHLNDIAETALAALD
jgi:TetR/AcrR family transcriptional regulator, transcriptional repressor for nem operon